MDQFKISHSVPTSEYLTKKGSKTKCKEQREKLMKKEGQREG